MAHYFNTYNTIKEFNAALQGASPSRLFSARTCSSNYPERMKNGKRWYGTNSFDEANELLLKGDSENAKKMQEASSRIALSEKIGMQAKTKPFNSVCGFIPNVGAALAGSPLNMVNFQKVLQQKKVVTIVYALSIAYTSSAEEIINASAKIINAIMAIEAQGKRVNLFLLAGMRSLKKEESVWCNLKIKDSGSIFDKKKMAYPLINPSFFRRHIFKVIETQKGLTSKDFPNCYGYVANPEYIKTRLKEQNFPYDVLISYDEIKHKNVQQIEAIFKED